MSTRGDREARNLTYSAEEPNFIRNMRERMKSGAQRPKRSRANEDGPAVESLNDNRLGVATLSNESDSDDDIKDAQVVVLKEGKHLTREEYLDQKKEAQPEKIETSETNETNTTRAPGTMPKRVRRTGMETSTMAATREAIRARKESSTSTAKPRRARKENPVRLSFDPDA